MSNNKIMGILIKHQQRGRDKINNLQTIKVFAKINGKDIFPDVELPKKHKQGKPRPYAQRKQPERELVKQIIFTLNCHKCVAGVVKTKGTWTGQAWGKDPLLFIGVPDILVFHFPTRKMWFVECKVGYNLLSSEQIEFQQHCALCDIGHIVAYKVKDVEKIYA